MAYDEQLADRVRAVLTERDDVVERKMFGGLAFMVAGSMACGIMGDDLLARVARDRHEEALARPHTRVMAFTGRPMRGFVIVGAPAIKTKAALKKWVDETVAVAVTQPKRKKERAKRALPKTARTSERLRR